MGRHIARRWVLAASLGCMFCGAVMPAAQAGPANSVARYLGVGWSEGRHARNNCPHSLHPSKPWSFPLSKLWNNETAGPFAGNGPGQAPIGAIASPPPPQQYAPPEAAPQPRPNVAPPRTPAPAKSQREELRGGHRGEDEERSPSDQSHGHGDDEKDLPPPPDDEPYPIETRSPRSIMRNRAAGR